MSGKGIHPEDCEVCGWYGHVCELRDGTVHQLCTRCQEDRTDVVRVRSNYPHPVTVEEARTWARRIVERKLRNGSDVETIASITGGGATPARRNHPAVRWTIGCGVRRGAIEVEIEGAEGSARGTFRIADLAREVQSGASQLGLFG